MSKQIARLQKAEIGGVADWQQVVREQWPTLTDPELVHFAEVCKGLNLNPFLKHVHPVKRWDNRQKKEVMTLQIGIDGMRLMAQRSGAYAGQRTFWCGADGVWHDVWISTGEPVAAKVEVYRTDSDHPTVAVATMSEYKQVGRDGKAMGLWAKMPANQLAKCAESIALRKALPGELAGLYSAEEMGQADNAFSLTAAERDAFLNTGLAAGFTEAQVARRLELVGTKQEYDQTMLRFEQAVKERGDFVEGEIVDVESE